MCVMPGRLDIGKHYISRGGIEGIKEGADALTSRILSFGRYIFDLEAQPVIKKLFESDRFLKAARGVCPDAKQYLDPFQFNFIIQVPGQTVPLHIDGAYFWGATRFQVTCQHMFHCLFNAASVGLLADLVLGYFLTVPAMALGGHGLFRHARASVVACHSNS